LDPEEAVVHGLAVRAAVLMGHSIPQLKDILMMDMLSSSIGLISWADIKNSGTELLMSNPEDRFNDISKDILSRSLHAVVVGSTTEKLPVVTQWPAMPPKSLDVCVVGDRYIRYFEPILHRCDHIPCAGTKVFRIEDPKQKFVSLDIFEEVEAEDSFENDSTCDIVDAKKYSYQLIGTYDLPIPKPKKASELGEEALTRNKSWLRRCTDYVNKYFGLQSGAGYNNISGVVTVKLGIDCDGAISFTILNDGVEDNDLSPEIAATDYSIVILICVLLVVAVLYVYVRIAFVELKFSESQNSSR
jgi:hypothetical protein